MAKFQVGDIVVRKSYGGDVFFKITGIIKRADGNDIYVLKGTNIRLMADSTASDLIKPEMRRISENDEAYVKKVNSLVKKVLLQRKGSQPFRVLQIEKADETKVYGRSGKVLHIDGDEEYLNVCLKGYKRLNVNVAGKFVPEAQQPNMILEALKEHRPDILVLTGHDGMIKGSKDYMNLDNYRNSRYFIESVKIARDYEKSYDDLIIFAGACQSLYEALIESGANFASSPSRVLIHAMDPVFICEKLAFTSISKFVPPKEVLDNTITGDKGIGGLETRGKYREGAPKSQFS